MMQSSPVKPGWVDVAQTPGERGREDFQFGWQEFAGQFFSYMSILDVGAGLAQSRSRLSIGNNVVTLQDLAPHEGLDIVGSTSNLPDKSYDVVTNFDVIEHVAEDIDFVQELIRLARRCVFITTPNWNFHKCANIWHCREYKPEEFVKLARGYKARWFMGDPHGHDIKELCVTDFVEGKNPMAHLGVVIEADTPFRHYTQNAFSCILPTVGRVGLRRAIESFLTQDLIPGDELWVVNDGGGSSTSNIVREYEKKHPNVIKLFETGKRHGDWGHTARMLTFPKCTGEYCLHMDDDDVFAPGIFAKIRKDIQSRAGVYMYRMQYMDQDRLVWKDPVPSYMNVGTPMIVHRLEPSGYGIFHPYRGGDWDFIRATVKFNTTEWKEDVIALINPPLT